MYYFLLWPNNSQNLDPSVKTSLDFGDCFSAENKTSYDPINKMLFKEHLFYRFENKTTIMIILFSKIFM